MTALYRPVHAGFKYAEYLESHSSNDDGTDHPTIVKDWWMTSGKLYLSNKSLGDYIEITMNGDAVESVKAADLTELRLDNAQATANDLEHSAGLEYDLVESQNHIVDLLYLMVNDPTNTTEINKELAAARLNHDRVFASREIVRAFVINVSETHDVGHSPIDSPIFKRYVTPLVIYLTNKNPAHSDLIAALDKWTKVYTKRDDFVEVSGYLNHVLTQIPLPGNPPQHPTLSKRRMYHWTDKIIESAEKEFEKRIAAEKAATETPAPAEVTPGE